MALGIQFIFNLEYSQLIACKPIINGDMLFHVRGQQLLCIACILDSN